MSDSTSNDGSSLSFMQVNVAPNPAAAPAISKAEQVLRHMDKLLIGERPDLIAVAASALAANVYLRGQGPTLPPHITVESESGERENIEPEQESKKNYRKGILKAVEEELFTKTNTAPAGQSAYYEIYQPKANQSTAPRNQTLFFVVKGTDVHYDWTGHNIPVNFLRLSDISQHCIDAFNALLSQSLKLENHNVNWVLVGHSLGGQVVQTISAMVFAYGFCSNDNDYLIKTFNNQDNYKSIDDFQAHLQKLWAAMVVWAVDPPGTTKVIDSIFSSIGLKKEIMDTYHEHASQQYFTLIGRLNCVNCAGIQLIKPTVFTAAYNKIPAITTTLNSYYTNSTGREIDVNSHKILDLASALFRHQHPMSVLEQANFEWGDGHPLIKITRVIASPVTIPVTSTAGLFARVILGEKLPEIAPSKALAIIPGEESRQVQIIDPRLIFLKNLHRDPDQEYREKTARIQQYNQNNLAVLEAPLSDQTQPADASANEEVRPPVTTPSEQDNQNDPVELDAPLADQTQPTDASANEEERPPVTTPDAVKHTKKPYYKSFIAGLSISSGTVTGLGLGLGLPSFSFIPAGLSIAGLAIASGALSATIIGLAVAVSVAILGFAIYKSYNAGFFPRNPSPRTADAFGVSAAAPVPAVITDSATLDPDLSSTPGGVKPPGSLS